MNDKPDWVAVNTKRIAEALEALIAKDGILEKLNWNLGNAVKALQGKPPLEK